MKIKSRGYLFWFIYLSLIFIGLPLFLITFGIFQIENKKDIVLVFIFFVFVFFIYYRVFNLFKIYNYTLELQEDFIIYSFFSRRKIRYSNVDRMYWSTIKMRNRTIRDVLKITFKKELPIVICIDKLTAYEKGQLIENLQKKSRRNFNCSAWKKMF